MTCHIPLASRTAKSRPLREGRPPAAPEGAGTGQGLGRHTLTRLTPGSLLRPRSPVSPETLRPGPIGRHRPSPPGRFNIFPVRQGSSWGWSVPKRGRENRPSTRARMGPRSGEGKRGVDQARYGQCGRGHWASRLPALGTEARWQRQRGEPATRGLRSGERLKRGRLLLRRQEMAA